MNADERIAKNAVEIAAMFQDPQRTAAILNTRVLKLTRLDSIQAEPVRWLWKYRIAIGMFGLFAGREGLGKSLVVYDLVARITRGTLDGDVKGTPRGVLICATEDSFAHTVVPRLIAARADLTRISKVDVVVGERDDDLTLPVDLPALSQKIQEQQIALVVLDPLLSRLSSKLDTHKDAEVRRALEPLVKLADATDAAVLGIIHLNKSTSGDPLNLIMGSRAFSAVSRYALHIVPDPDDDKTRLVGQSKNNVGPSDGLPLLPFRIAPYEFDNERGQRIETARVEWREEDRSRGLREVMRDSTNRDDTRSDDAADWLEGYLSNAEGKRAKSQEVKREAQKAGHKERTIKRAAKKLGLLVEHGARNATWWTLPDLPLEDREPF